MANPEWTEPGEYGDREMCGYCGEDVDCFGICDCPGAVESALDA